jgi:hypothetical protein
MTQPAGLPAGNSTLVQVARELQWLKRNPAFKERPASILEFLGEDYLNIAAGVREGVKEALVSIFGDEPNVYNLALVQRAIFTGAIGIGKTTFASIALPYMCHWCLCLKDPQGFFGLLPGSRIAFMQMSTSETQAKEVLFGDIFARIKHSPWFKNHPYDEKFKNQIRFPHDIWIVPGDSSETTFEGYNILGGIVDEIDSHKVTEKKDYAEEGYNTISSRVSSRFQDRGLVILIGQTKRSTGFAQRKYTEFAADGIAGGSFAVRMTIWESLGWPRFLNPDGTRNSFWFDLKRKQIVSDLIVDFMNKEDLMEIPNVYKKEFTNNPEKALRDLAGIPPLVGEAFISMVEKVEACRTKWHTRYGLEMEDSPIIGTLSKPDFAEWFRATETLQRVAHIDIAYSANGDALGLAVGHVRELVEVDGEIKPVIVFDCLIRMRPLPGTQIILSDVRQILYRLKEERGFRLKAVTLDGFQSTDTMQQFQKKKFNSWYLSVDKDILPYHDLREAIYEGRVEFPKYMTHMRHGDVERVEIAVQELLRLVVTDRGKIDHPEGGSKDVSDAMAGVVTTLMADRQYRKGAGSSSIGSAGANPAAASALVRGFPAGSSGSRSDSFGGLPAMPQMPSMPNIGNLGDLRAGNPPR